ncbi:MAG: glycine-rich protein [Janthinobacterium lividum]
MKADFYSPPSRWLLLLALPLAGLLATASAAQAQTITFGYNGNSNNNKTYTVPAGVTKLNVVAAGGASGASPSFGRSSTPGAVVQATVTVVPGEVLTVVVGGMGGDYVSGSGGGVVLGGYNGGGSTGHLGGGAGGATDLRRTGMSTGDYFSSRNALLVAGGAGGTGQFTGGGAGGTPNGGNGGDSVGNTGGGGATTTAPGTSATGGNAGSNGTGGDGASRGGGGGAVGGGGGGGGYYGGGGGYLAGTSGDAAGGGGSSYVLPTGASNISYSVAAAASSGALTITPVASLPTLTSLSPTSGPVGSSVTLTGTNLTGAIGVSFNGTAATTFAVVNATTVTATVPAGATSGPVTVTTAGGTSNGVAFTIITDLVVTTTTTIVAGIYSSITVNSPGVGTLAGNVTVTTSTTVTSGGMLNDGCATISGAGSFTLAAGGTLGICNAAGITSSGAAGAVQVTGTRTFSTDASYVYNGTAAQSTGNGLPAQVRNLSTTNANAVTLTAPTSVAQVLTVGGAGNLALNGNALTLLSSAAGTALVVNSSAGVVSGSSAVVQRYIDGSLNSGPGYRHFSVPVTGSTLADFATSSFTPVLNPAFNSSPTPATVTPFPTLYLYNQSALTRTNNLSAFDKGWLSPSSLTDGATPGLGYCLNLSAGQVVDLVGTLYNTTLTVGMSRTTGATAADGGWALIGNPYPAPLDLSLVQPTDRQNLDAATYVVQSTGQYAGGYRAYVNGVSTSATNNPLLALGQGFFARVSAGQTTGSFTFRNNQRVTTYATQAAFQRTTTDPRPQVRLELAGAGLADGWVTYVETGATPAFDSQFDAGKLPNSTGLNLSSSLGTDNLAIDGQPAFTTSTVLPLAVGVPAAGTYTLSASAINNLPAGLVAYLRDSQTGQQLLLAAGTSYSFSVTVAQAATLLTGRFALVFRAQSPLATVAALAASDVTVYPNPAHASFVVALPGVAGASTVQAELFNALGQVVRRQSVALPTAGTALTMPTADLAAGVYVLRLQAGTTTLAKRVVIQ